MMEENAARDCPEVIAEVIRAPDGFKLALTRYEPRGAAIGTVVISNAMGVTQRYYSEVAHWLSGQQFRVLTLDPRGVGDSTPAVLPGFRATLDDWIQQDYFALLVRAKEFGVPVCWLGHSLGGQILPLVPNANIVDRVVIVASGNGYWRHHKWQTRVLTAWVWYCVAVPAIAIAGYFPGRRLRKVGDLPAGVMLQWRSWCLDRRYSADTPRAAAKYQAFNAPIWSISFTDDEYMSARNTSALHRMFSASKVTVVRLKPESVGLRKIGHFGFFRRDSKDLLWKNHLLPALAINPPMDSAS